MGRVSYRVWWHAIYIHHWPYALLLRLAAVYIASQALYAVHNRVVACTIRTDGAQRERERESATACRSAGDRSVYGCCPCTGPVCVGSVFVHPAPSARLQQHRSVRRDESLIGRTHIRMERLVLSHSLTRLSRSLTHQTISRLILYRLRTAIFIYKVSLYKLVSFHTSSQCRAFEASR